MEPQMKRTLIALSLASLGTLGAGSAFAYNTYTGEDANGSSSTIPAITPNATGAQGDFLGSFGNNNQPGVETFEGQAVALGSITLGFGSGNTAVNATLSSANGGVASVITPNDGRFSVPGGNKFWAASARTGGDTFTITFSGKVEAFGFFGIDIGDFGGNLSMELLDAAGNQMGSAFAVGGSLSSAASDGAVLYFGIVAQSESEWFRGIRFRLANSTANEDLFAFDSFTVVGAPQPAGTNVPEPGSLALASLALLGLGMARRRA